MKKEDRESVRIYYFYHPRCPNCQAVEPLINYLVNNTEIDFVMCNVEHFKDCSNKSKSIAIAVKKKTGFFGTPTAVVEENNNFRVFIGKYQVMKMVEYLGNFTEIPKIELNNSRYNISDCIECHAKKGLKPPSNYTCNYCCHGI